MDKTLKESWIEALRSGEYEQTQETLLRKDGPAKSYCCLGVLCAISDEVFENDDDDIPFMWGDNKDYDAVGFVDGELATPFINHIGMPHSHQSTLIGMNDIGKTFATIADWIEENL